MNARVAVEVVDDNLPKPLDNEDRVLLFRAVRELLFNVLKHAQADSAKVCMHRNGDHLRVIVEDNGVGFTPEKLAASTGKIEGFGLFSIRERLNYFGGTMEIESSPGKLTRVILTIALQPSKRKRTSPGGPDQYQGSHRRRPLRRLHASYRQKASLPPIDRP